MTVAPASGSVYAALGNPDREARRQGTRGISGTADFDAGEQIEGLTVDGSGRLWAAGVHRLSSMGVGEEGFVDECLRLSDLCTTPDQTPLDLDRSGHLWAAGDSALFRREGERWRRLDTPPGWATGLLHDREDSLWSWQTGVGLHRVLGDGRWESWTREEGLPGDTVWSIHRDRAGRLWVGTSEGLVRATPQGWVPVAGTAGFAVRSIARGRRRHVSGWAPCPPRCSISILAVAGSSASPKVKG